MSETEIEELYYKVIDNLDQYDYYMQLRRKNKVVDSNGTEYDMSYVVNNLFSTLKNYGLILDNEKKVLNNFYSMPSTEDYTPYESGDRSNYDNTHKRKIALKSLVKEILPKKIEFLDNIIKLKERNLQILTELNMMKQVLKSDKFKEYSITTSYTMSNVYAFLQEFDAFMDENSKEEIKSSIKKYCSEKNCESKRKMFENILTQITRFSETERTQQYMNWINYEINILNNGKNTYPIREDLLLKILDKYNIRECYEKFVTSNTISKVKVGVNYVLIDDEFFEKLNTEINNLGIDANKISDIRKEYNNNEQQLQDLKNVGYKFSDDINELKSQRSDLNCRINDRSNLNKFLWMMSQNEHSLQTIGERIYPLSGQVSKYQQEFYKYLSNNTKQLISKIDEDYVNGKISVDTYISSIKEIYIDSIRNFCNISMVSKIGMGNNVMDFYKKDSKKEIISFLSNMNEFTSKLNSSHLKLEDELKTKIESNYLIHTGQAKPKGLFKKINVFIQSLNKKKLKSQRVSLVGNALLNTMRENKSDIRDSQFYRVFGSLLRENNYNINDVINSSRIR